jgi:hypothetical protein
MLADPSQIAWYRGHVQRMRSALVVTPDRATESAVARSLGTAWRVFAVPTPAGAAHFLGGVLVDVVLAEADLLIDAGAPFFDGLARTPRVSTIPIIALAPRLPAPGVLERVGAVVTVPCAADELRAVVAALLRPPGH